LIAFARRASALLYRFLQASPRPGAWLLPANVCPVVPATLRAAGRTVRLLDVVPVHAPGGLGLDPAGCLEALADPAIEGLIYVHPFGVEHAEAPAIYRAFRERRPDLLVVDDRCSCRPRFEGVPTAGADVTLYSTGHGKFLDLGTGGFAFLAPAALIAPPAHAGRHGSVIELAPHGDASRLDLVAPEESWESFRERGLRALPGITQHKQRLNAVYQELLPAGVSLPEIWHSWRYNLLLDDAEGLLARLFAAGLFASRHYPVLGGDHERHPVAARLHARIVNLFNDLHYSEEQARHTAELVTRHVRR
jgi:hypothetical protein